MLTAQDSPVEQRIAGSLLIVDAPMSRDRRRLHHLPTGGRAYVPLARRPIGHDVEAAAGAHGAPINRSRSSGGLAAVPLRPPGVPGRLYRLLGKDAESGRPSLTAAP